MQRWTASAAGGISQRLNPGGATVRSRSSSSQRHYAQLRHYRVRASAHHPARSAPHFNQVLLQHRQVQAQMVKLLHVAERDIHVSHLVLDVFQAREFLVQLGARQAGNQSLVDFPQVRIPEVDLAPGSPAHQRRGSPDQRHHQHDHRDQHHLGPIDQRRQPERE